MTIPRLPGKRIMVVDDEPGIAMLLEAALMDEACVVFGPFDGVAQADQTARTGIIDYALLDVNVADGKIFPIARLLEQRGIPFLLLSGYGDGGMPNDQRHWPVASKPFSIALIIDRVCAALGVRH